MKLRIEVFPADLDRFADFYLRVLRFELVSDKREEPAPYLSVRRGDVKIGATRAWAPTDPSARAIPQGVELVLEVDDLAVERDALIAEGWPIADDITVRSWGLSDFRVFDPDGNYLRFTTR